MGMNEQEIKALAEFVNAATDSHERLCALVERWMATVSQFEAQLAELERRLLLIVAAEGEAEVELGALATRIAALEEKAATLPEFGMRLRALERVVGRLSNPANATKIPDPEAEPDWVPHFHQHE